jgi:hypothetical protein
VKSLFVSMAVLACSGSAAAQVGHAPANSPFRDLQFRQELTTYSGYFAGAKGTAGVGPRGGALAGVRYEIRVGGPAHLTARVAHVWSERTVLDPAKIGAARTVGTKDLPLVLSDVGLTINLTGQKSIVRFVPVIHGGIGIVADVGGQKDPGGFQIGTPFALSFGGGVRWVPGGQWQLRLDFADYLFRLKYPSSYVDQPSSGVPPILDEVRTGEWKHNAALSLGISYLFSR